MTLLTCCLALCVDGLQVALQGEGALEPPVAEGTGSDVVPWPAPLDRSVLVHVLHQPGTQPGVITYRIMSCRKMSYTKG